jgi:alpha-1,2-mannosyltransferase
MIVLSILLFVISLSQLMSSLIHTLGNGIPLDLEVYLSYTRHFLQGGHPYQQTISLNYPPSSLLLFAPFTLLPSSWIAILFTVLSMISLFICIWLMCLILKKNRTFFLLIATLLIQFFPTKFTLGMGQINLIVLLFVISGLYADRKGKQVLGGSLIGLGSALKLSPLSLLLYFLIRRRWKALLATFITFLLLNGIPHLFDSTSIVYFTHQLPSLLSSVNNASSLYDQSLKAFLIRLDSGMILFHGSHTPPYIAFLLIGTLLLWGVWQYHKKTHIWHSVFVSDNLFVPSLILAGVTIGNSFAWQHHFVLLYPLVIVLLAKPPPQRRLRGTLALGVLMLASKSFVSGGLLGLVTENTTIIGSLILIVLVLGKQVFQKKPRLKLAENIKSLHTPYDRKGKYFIFCYSILPKFFSCFIKCGA